MDAKHIGRWFVLFALLGLCGATYRTENFVVSAPTPALAKQFALAAERYRVTLALEWLGRRLPDWSRPCYVTAHVGEHLGAGGATTFVFDRGEVFGWRMTVQGSAQRILDSVLPHEITHTILASHFRQPLPRWADEGAATSVEHPVERSKQYRMLLQFLRSGRGIPFARMFRMDEYPADMLPLYAQGYTLAEFLIQQGGRRRFVEFLEDGLNSGDWQAAIRRHYGYRDLGQLQTSWLAWVKAGFPSLGPAEKTIDREKDELQLAGTYPKASSATVSGGRPLQPVRATDVASGWRPLRALPGDSKRELGPLVPVDSPTAQHISLAEAGVGSSANPGRPKTASGSLTETHVGRAGQAVSKGAEALAGTGQPVTHPSSKLRFRDMQPAQSAEVSRPQPLQPARQVILEWSRNW